MKRLFFYFGVISLLLLLATNSYADFITNLTVNITTDKIGKYDYKYILYNDLTSTIDPAALVISVDSNANLQDITGPVGWDISYAPGSGILGWESEDSSTDLQPGSSFTFGFTSTLGPTQQAYVINGYDDPNSDLSTNYGQIAGPGLFPIPEPMSMIPLSIGMVTLAGYSVYHGKRKQ